MSKRVLCKFFAHGACLKGEHCEFSHDWKDPPHNICTYYQKGLCAYGSRCRYEHVKASRSHSSASSSSTNARQSLVSDIVPPGNSTRSVLGGLTPVPGSPMELSASSRPFIPPTKPAWNQEYGHHDSLDDWDIGEASSIRPSDRPICSFAAAGNCPRGEKCPHLHGDLCPTCGKHCLHPFRPEEREEHLKSCEKKQKHLEALKHSQEIECSVCLERVLSKPTAAERKFGLLSECDHPFCISCIRNWRSSSPTSGMDVNSALRACPICRKLSYFVIPSVIWYSSKEEKQDIVDSYKAKLKSIDCKHFDFGNGNCPFGSSCFYKHKVKPGSYTWRHHRPPPRRPPPRRSGFVDDLFDMFNSIEELTASETALDPMEELTSLEMALLLRDLILDTSDSSSDEEDFYSPFMSLLSLKHAYRDGRLEEVVLRHLGSEDGEAVIAKNIRLSEFLGNMRIRISNDMEKSCATSIAEFFSNASVALQLFLRFSCWRGPEHGVLGMIYYLSRCIFYQSNKNRHAFDGYV